MVRMEIKKLYFVTQKSRYPAENLIVEELCSIADLMGDNSKSILLSKVQTGSK